MENITLSIIIPAYNEEKRISKTILSVKNYFVKKNFSYELIVVDDGSKDKTVEVVKSFYNQIPNYKVLVNEVNRGKGYSVNRGMSQATGKYRLFMDADGSVDISHIDAFIKSIDSGVDVAIASIKVGQEEVIERNGWHRRILGKMANYVIQMLAVPGILDTQRGFKLFSANSAKVIFPLQTIDRWGFDIELLVIARNNGLKIKELPVSWDNADGSTVTLKSYIHTLMELMYISKNRILGRYTSSVFITA